MFEKKLFDAFERLGENPKPKSEVSTDDLRTLEEGLNTFREFMKNFSSAHGYDLVERTKSIVMPTKYADREDTSCVKNYHWGLVKVNNTLYVGFNVTVNKDGLFIVMDYLRIALKNKKYKTYRNLFDKIINKKAKHEISVTDLLKCDSSSLSDKIKNYFFECSEAYNEMQKIEHDLITQIQTDIPTIYVNSDEDDEDDSLVSEGVDTEEMDDKTIGADARYWIYAPGEQACKWSDCTANQIMCIAWEELGDLTKYESREDMVKALKEAYGKPNASYMHDSLALWQFVHDMKPGDVIYAKKGVKNVIGRGVVMDEYVFDEEADNYNNIRKVKWTNVGNWKVNFDRQLPLKTLTRIDTNDQKFADDIEALFAEKKTIKQEPFDISSLISAIESTKLIYKDTLIKRFAYSLLTKPFVILSGLAGSGKTQLALACAKALVEDVDSQICFVSVGADWTNREPLLGFPNALKDDVYQTPESGALQLMIEAEGNPEKPYFLILDEMNLSYVERYFADFLSAMEAKDMKIKLWDKDACGVPSSVSLPKNLFIVGTINVDETTYMFSPKVLDRANVIEFKVSEEDMVSFLDKAPDVNMSKCEGMAANMAKSFVEIAGGSKAISTVANDVLKKFFKELKTVNAEFGYRTATEIGRFISLATENKSMNLNDAIDAAIVQKLLPKLHGSRKKIVKVLEPLFAECCCGKKLAELEEKDYAAVVEDATYRLSADKILRMYNSAIENGFTSFAEA